MLKATILVVLFSLPLVVKGCSSHWVGDGYCDRSCNNRENIVEAMATTVRFPLHPPQFGLSLTPNCATSGVLMAMVKHSQTESVAIQLAISQLRDIRHFTTSKKLTFLLSLWMQWSNPWSYSRSLWSPESSFLPAGLSCAWLASSLTIARLSHAVYC